jgi:hypothetical protein
MAKKATAKEKAIVASVERPSAGPDNYVWDPKMGPIDPATGKPTGAWKEPQKGNS